ncbi:MAG TPA: hypothetical protein PKA06_05830, partial [Gemmatales bacterium]|nr:hypothetical protein [Gemmatales bacterium]
ILYELLTGRPPFRGETVAETLVEIQTAQPLPPRKLRPKLPRDLETICLHCLEKTPQRRYATALQLADDLDRYLITSLFRYAQLTSWNVLENGYYVNLLWLL